MHRPKDRFVAMRGVILLIGFLSEGIAPEAAASAAGCTVLGTACVVLQPVLGGTPADLNLTPRESALLEPVRALEPEGWLGRFWREHRYHILTVFLVEQADHIYEDKVGPPETPRLFGSPSGLDRSVRDRYPSDSSTSSFIAANKSAINQVLSMSAIVWANGGRLDGVADDVMGLIEAHKLNWSINSLVKNIVGRRRPSLEEAVAGGDPAAIERFGPSSRNSFYSDAASKAFTYMAYTDSVLARRFEHNRAARAWSAVGLYSLATYVAYTRIEQGKHYLSDVVVGAGAGLLVGKCVYRMNHRHEGEGSDEASVRIQPVLVPGGAGISLSARY